MIGVVYGDMRDQAILMCAQCRIAGPHSFRGEQAYAAIGGGKVYSWRQMFSCNTCGLHRTYGVNSAQTFGRAKYFAISGGV